MAQDPCPGREISYFGRVTCRPFDAFTRAFLPAVAIGASIRAMTYPGPQYDVPLYDGVLRGAAAGAMFGAAIIVTAYVKQASDSNALAAVTGLVAIPAALYGSFKAGAIPTA